MSRRMPSASMVVALIALSVAMSGSAVAASLITGKQIKNRSITSKDISRATMRSLQGRDGLDGEPGDTGPTGPQGPAGPPGPSSIAQQTPVTVSATVAPGDVDHATATCPPGQGAVNGDWTYISAGGAVFFEDLAPGSFSVGADNFSSSLTGDLEVTVYCVPLGAAAGAVARKLDAGRLDALDAKRAAAHR